MLSGFLEKYLIFRRSEQSRSLGSEEISYLVVYHLTCLLRRSELSARSRGALIRISDHNLCI